MGESNTSVYSRWRRANDPMPFPEECDRLGLALADVESAIDMVAMLQSDAERFPNSRGGAAIAEAMKSAQEAQAAISRAQDAIPGVAARLNPLLDGKGHQFTSELKQALANMRGMLIRDGWRAVSMQNPDWRAAANLVRDKRCYLANADYSSVTQKLSLSSVDVDADDVEAARIAWKALYEEAMKRTAGSMMWHPDGETWTWDETDEDTARVCYSAAQAHSHYQQLKTLLAAKAPVAASAGERNDEVGGIGKTTDTDWKDVQLRLLAKRDQGEPYTTIRKLAVELVCANATISKAINDSDTLKGWAARIAVRKAAPKATDLGAAVKDNVQQSTEPAPDEVLPDEDVDSTMARLIEQAKPEERAKLNELDDAGRRELVATYNEQNRDDEPSPLDRDKPGERPRKVMHYKRV